MLTDLMYAAMLQTDAFAVNVYKSNSNNNYANADTD